MSSEAVLYTGGDIKGLENLERCLTFFDNSKSRKSGPVTNASSRIGSFGGSASSVVTSSSGWQKSHSGPLNKLGESVKKSSGPQTGGIAPLSRQNSGPIPPVLPTTGLITSGPISSGPLNSSGAPRKVSGPFDSIGLAKLQRTTMANNQAVTKLSQDVTLLIWNHFWGRRAVVTFISQYPDVELRTAKDGQYIKITGVVTCGNVPLESSFQKVPRCVYTSSSLYEYRGWESKAVNPQHRRRFTWGIRSVEKNVVDFYISDFQSGLRALVKTGYGASVSPYVDESVIVDMDINNKEISAEFLRWLRERNLSSDGRMLCLKEGLEDRVMVKENLGRFSSTMNSLGLSKDAGRSLPKFGEWDVNDPSSADSFTVIFNKARDEKKTGSNNQGSSSPPKEPSIKQGTAQTSKSSLKKWCCCLSSTPAEP
ncbi:hypothetical protein HPP92_018240 [Vanilla planifolia]|uniref:RIN4 pathogenic type III effector avirulence factor Avr cleavage site domain-containing protein n=1 Tax=Vanilla planifolia TaxID=51239 RepID=A0A835QJL0_VANPL|nr:hypothetical protein HPP92_018240 [Vanilla planifolia]